MFFKKKKKQEELKIIKQKQEDKKEIDRRIYKELTGLDLDEVRGGLNDKAQTNTQM